MAELDSAIDNYEEVGPLGSTDRRIPINVDLLHARLNEENSTVAELWSEPQMKEWVKTLGDYCPDVTLGQIGCSFILTYSPGFII